MGVVEAWNAISGPPSRYIVVVVRGGRLWRYGSGYFDELADSFYGGAYFFFLFSCFIFPVSLIYHQLG